MILDLFAAVPSCGPQLASPCLPPGDIVVALAQAFGAYRAKTMGVVSPVMLNIYACFGTAIAILCIVLMGTTFRKSNVVMRAGLALNMVWGFLFALRLLADAGPLPVAGRDRLGAGLAAAADGAGHYRPGAVFPAAAKPLRAAALHAPGRVYPVPEAPALAGAAAGSRALDLAAPLHHAPPLAGFFVSEIPCSP